MPDATEEKGLLSDAKNATLVNSADDPISMFLKDDPSDMGFVRKSLSGKVIEPYKPSLQIAWAYFEHVTLPRYFVHNKEIHGEYVLAEKGESDEATRLYPVWDTPAKDLGDFGIGIGIYFWTLKCLAYILLLGGIINIPVLEYYSSFAYRQNITDGFNWFLRASAICTNYEWAACPTCTADDWDGRPFSAKSTDRYAATADGQHRFILVNRCGDVTLTQGFCSLAAVIFVITAIYVMQWHSKKAETKLDEAVQTASDYSVQVENPPFDEGYDPEDWKSYFSQFGTVVAVTVAVDNEGLTKVLLERRSYLKLLVDRLPANFKYNKHDLEPVVNAAEPLAWYERLMMSYDPEGLHTKIKELDENIRASVKQRYNLSQVFVTFDTEEGQRNALRKLEISTFDSLHNNKSVVPEEYLFKGKHMLRLSEPAEPNTIRWTDLDETILVRMKARLHSSFLMAIFILFDVILLNTCFLYFGAGTTGFAVTFMNYASFYVITFFVSYESHPSEGERESSMYLKANLFSVINTIGISVFLTPFADTLSGKEGSNLNALYAIYFYAIIQTPILQICDPKSFLFTFVLAPQAPDQRRMNSYFKGSYWNLSQRYTAMSIVLYLTMFYSVLFPSGYLLGSMALAVQYWTDKFCLLRMWSPKPALGNTTAKNDRLVLNLMIVLFAMFSAGAYSSFPYDNTCDETTIVPSDYVGSFTAFDIDKVEVQIPPIASESTSSKFCDQDIVGSVLTSFHWRKASEEWMNSDQKEIAAVFGWTSIVVTLVVSFLLYLKLKKGPLRKFFFKVYEPDGVASAKKFSELKEVALYIPQERVFGNSFPLLLIDTSDIATEFIGWTDPYNLYEEHNVIFDVSVLADMMDSPAVDEKKMFGAFKYWPSSEKRENDHGDHHVCC